MNANTSYHTQQCHTSSTRIRPCQSNVGCGSVIRLALLALAAQSDVRCFICLCDIICENILMPVTFYSINIFLYDWCKADASLLWLYMLFDYFGIMEWKSSHKFTHIWHVMYLLCPYKSKKCILLISVYNTQLQDLWMKELFRR